MTLQEILKTAIGVALIALGAILMALSFMAVNSLDKAIYYANLAVLGGESIFHFLHPIAGILSGGYLKIIDTKYIYLMVLVGWLFIWLGIQFVIFTKRGMPLRYLLGRKYWTVLDWEIIHRRKYRESDLTWFKKKGKGANRGRNIHQRDSQKK